MTERKTHSDFLLARISFMVSLLFTLLHDALEVFDIF